VLSQLTYTLVANVLAVVCAELNSASQVDYSSSSSISSSSNHRHQQQQPTHQLVPSREMPTSKWENDFLVCVKMPHPWTHPPDRMFTSHNDPLASWFLMIIIRDLGLHRSARPNVSFLRFLRTSLQTERALGESRSGHPAWHARRCVGGVGALAPRLVHRIEDSSFAQTTMSQFAPRNSSLLEVCSNMCALQTQIWEISMVIGVLHQQLKLQNEFLEVAHTLKPTEKSCLYWMHASSH